MAPGVEVHEGIKGQITHIPKGSVVSRMIHHNARLRVNLLGFAPGEKIYDSESAYPVTIEVLRGEGLVTLGDEIYEVREGTWMFVEAGTPHTIEARKEMLILLTMLRQKD